ncbi:MAG TPA: acyl-CoA reductase [Longimicrobiales bacterium]|nr:acyl-CoA reductase [Longimicrobiales bacterium]
MNAFRAWSFPEGFSWSGTVAEVACEPGGGRIAHPVLRGAEARALAGTVRAAGEEVLSARPAARIAGLLGRVGERFRDSDDPLTREAVGRLPEVAGLSGAMAERVVEGMARDWTRERLRALLEAEFADPAVLDGFRPGRGAARVRAYGPRLALHVSAGTVPGVSVTSLIRGLLVKSAVVLKPGRGDAVLPVLFARGLREEDTALSDALAVAYWPGGAGETEATLLEEAEAVVVHGGNEAVRRLRDRTPVTSRFVAYRHRLSVGLVGRGALDGEGGAGGVADAAARAVATFDQRGCVSPHAFYVERGGAVAVDEWARELARSLERIEEAWPSGPLLPEEAAEVQQVRGTAELEAAAEPGREVHHGGATAPWTVLVEPGPLFTPSCLGRVVRVHPVDRLEEALEALAPLRPHLQTVALACVGERRDELAELFAGAGAVRITSMEEAPWPPAWWHHDGSGALRSLVRWVDLER